MTSIDVSGNLALQRLSADMTSLSSIDVSNNKELRVLNVGYTKMTSVDVSGNPKLEELYLDVRNDSPYKFKSVDLSKNPELKVLFASYNGMSELDISHNPKMKSLYFAENNLYSLDVSNNTEMIEAVLRNNNFDFNSLPFSEDALNYFSYSPQNDMAVKREISVGEALDLSKRVCGPDYETVAEVYLSDSRVPNGSSRKLSEGVDYTYENGVFKFLKAQSDSVYCSFRSDKYKYLTLETARFLVLNPEDVGKPSLAVDMTTDMPVGGTFSMEMSAIGGEREVEVDFGGGEPERFTLSDDPLKVSGTLKGKNVKVYTASEVQLTRFEAPGMQISNIDISRQRVLRTLNLNDNKLAALDLSGNLWLMCLMVDDNSLSSLSVKNLLDMQSISCSGNELESISLGQSALMLTTLDCSDNNLKILSALNNAPVLEVLDCSQNQLEELALSSNTYLRQLDASYNNLEELDLTRNAYLETVNVEMNNLRFSTLPETVAEDYSYSKQKNVYVAEKAFLVDLSSEAVVDNKPTSFVWKSESGNVLEEGEDYELDNGVTTFLKAYDEKVYAELKNETWPALTLATTLVSVADKPRDVVTRFVSTADEGTEVSVIIAANSPKSLYVDFGDGELKECRLESGNTTIKSALGHSKTITVYGYDESYYDLKTLSMSNVTLAEADVTKLKDLYTLNLSGAGLAHIDLSNNVNIGELSLGSNNLTEIDLTKFAGLKNLTLSSNKLAEIDLTNNRQLTMVLLGNNELEEIEIPELPDLFKLDVSNNKLTSLDITQCPVLRELDCSGNSISGLDLSGQEIFSQVNITNNNFRFSTLPEVNIYQSKYYKYAPQNEVEITVDGGRVDLGSEYMVQEMPTEYTWTTESGVTLVDGTDYTVENGVTTFMKSFGENVYCEMTNGAYPELTLKTTGVMPVASGIGGIAADGGVSVENGNIVVTADGGAQVLVYDVAGAVVRSVEVKDGTVVVDGLRGGVYMVDVRCDGQRLVKKVMIR